jgi:cell division protein FtsL
MTIALGASVYAMADKVQVAHKNLAKVEDQIAEQQESLRVLHAEWTFLTNPERLEKIATTSLQLGPSNGGEYVEIAAIPMRDFIEQQQQENEQTAQTETPAAPAVKTAAVAPAHTDIITKKAKGAAAIALPTAAQQKLPTLQATPVSAVTEMRDE